VEKVQRTRTATAGVVIAIDGEGEVGEHEQVYPLLVVSVSAALSHHFCRTAAGFWTVARPGPAQ
jgi:hypothetical protein